jgi:hypothetical protein
MSHMGGVPATDDLCGGLSPCDAYDYGHDIPGVPGICFLPPMVDNHLSDPACSGDFVPGLDGAFKLAWCQVEYENMDGSVPPTKLVPLGCQDPSQWRDLVQDPNGGEFYAANVQWRRNEADVGDVFRLYVVRGDTHWAHRDVIIAPNETRPADDFVHSIGYGTEPVKVRITESLECVYYDTQGGTLENAATCLIDGATSFGFVTERVNTTFDFPDGNPSFFADFEVSECLSLGFDADDDDSVSGNALVDVPLGGCKISMSSQELTELTVPAQIFVDLAGGDPPFGADARPNVLQYDEFGVAALPPTDPPVPNWFGDATSESAMLRFFDWGLDKVAQLVSFFGPQPLYAWPGAGFDFTRMSDFQLAWMAVITHAATGEACASALPSCLDLGTVPGTAPIQAGVHVTAPSIHVGDPDLDVPGARLHFFPQTGSVACPAVQPAGGQQCYEPTDPPSATDDSTTPPSTWDHLVVVTGLDGRGVVDWTLAAGDNTLDVSACGVARPGANEPNAPEDGVWGALVFEGEGCADREAALTDSDAYDNGPADGFTPFEPVDTENEVAIYGLPLTFEAKTCPQIAVDGLKEVAWEACAEKTAFSAPLAGPKGAENAWLYTFTDGDALYLGLEVINNELGNKIFVNLVESFDGNDGVAAAGDDILLIDFGNASAGNDWYLTQACLGNNASSLCGAADTTTPDGDDHEVVAMAKSDGAAGHAFYEFKRPLGSLNAASGPGKQDLGAEAGEMIGLRLQITQGQGGGKGGFTYPDPQTSPVKYHSFTLD